MKGGKCEKKSGDCADYNYNTNVGCINKIDKCSVTKLVDEKSDIVVYDLYKTRSLGFLTCQQCNPGYLLESKVKCDSCSDKFGSCQQCNSKGCSKCN